MTAAIQITNDGVYSALILAAAVPAIGLFVGWLERTKRIPMTDHERIPNDPTRSNR